MRRRFWKVLGIGTLLFAMLASAAVAAFVFNPFEGSLPDMRELVPRDVDFFVRKTDLARDFTEFPEPEFWAELSSSRSWRSLQAGPAYRHLERELAIERAVEQLRRAAQEIAAGSGGFADLLADAIGTDLIVAGKFTPAAACAYTRVSWKLRFAWGLLQWSGVRDRLRANGLDLKAQDDGTLLLESRTGKPLHLARHLDCLMVSDDRAFLQQSLELAEGRAGREGFGGSADYRDGVETRIRDWEKVADTRANAVELYVRPDQLLTVTGWADNWPDPRHPDDMNQRVLASFLNLQSWRFLSGALIFEPRSLTVLGRIDLNRNKHSGFQTQFFKTEPQERSVWLDPFLSMVPEGACAAAGMRMPAGDFLTEMYEALDQDLKDLLNELLRKTGKYDGGGRALIDALRPALEPRIGFVFYRARSLGPEVFSNEPSPAPHIAWVFWIRDVGRQAITGLYEFITQNSQTLGFTKAYDLNVSGLKGGDATREFLNPNIPGTGEIALLIYGNFFVVSNSGYLVKDMVGARIDARSIMQMPDYRAFEKELPNRLNGFVFVQGERMAEVMQDYLAHIEATAQGRDPEWELNNRARIEREVLRRGFPAYSSAASLPPDQRDRFERDLEAAMDEEWNKARARVTGADRAKIEQAQAMMRLFSSAYLQVILDPQSLTMTSRVLMDYR